MLAARLLDVCRARVSGSAPRPRRRCSPCLLGLRRDSRSSPSFVPSVERGRFRFRRRLPPPSARGRSSHKVTASLRFRARRSQPRIWAQVIRFPARAEEDSGQSERDALAGRGWERRMCAQGQARAPEGSESSLRCHTGRVLGRTPHGVAVQRPGERVFGLLAPGVHEDLCQSGTRAPAEKQRLRDPLARDARGSPSPIKPPARPALSGRRAGPSRGPSAES